MILKFVVILCVLCCLLIDYVWFAMNKMKKLTDKLEDYEDEYEHMCHQYYRAIGEVQKDFGNIEKQIDNQRKVTNGWGHKIDIIDRDLKKMKNVLVSVVPEEKLDFKE